MRSTILIVMLCLPMHSMSQTVTFGVVADVQYCDCDNAPRYNRYYAETPDRLREARDTFNAHELDFVINLGDMIDRGWESFDQILPIFDSIHAPTYHVLGNHDFSVADEKKGQVVSRLGMPGRYYDFVISNWRFIVLDANDLSLKAHPTNSPEYIKSDSLFQQVRAQGLVQARDWNGGIGEKQLMWLAQQLEEATKQQQNVLVFSHMPVTPDHANNLWNNTQVMELLERFDCVKAYFAGHNHDGAYVEMGGIHYVTFKGMLDTPDQNAYAIVEINDGKFQVRGFGREQQITPSATIYHDATEILAIEGSFQVGGIYPHLTTYSHGRVDGRQSYAGWAGRRGPDYGGQRECGIGAIVPWAGKLYIINYGAHEPEGSDHKLYIIDHDLRMELFQGSVGGTPAGRMIHQESNQLFIGHYAIDSDGNIRVISIEEMPGRMTAIARHLTDPENKVYYFDMEGMLYEVDVNTLGPTLLYQKPLPGWHGKGAYTAQGRLVMANNGEQVPFRIHEEWQVDTTGIRGPENFGVLAEYDGERFTVIERRQYTDVTTRHGIHAIPNDQSPLWSMGWDKRSVLLKVLDQGQWHTYLLPKATNNNDPFHGWFTEWPRIRELHEGQYMMDMHGMFFDFPAGFSSEDASGIRPIGSHLRFITDFTWWNGQVVISCNETSVQGNPYAGQPQSNLWFGSFEELAEWGPKTGYGSVWVEDEVMAGEASLPYLFAGFDRRVMHLVNHSDNAVEILVQFDRRGNGVWEDQMTFEVASDGYTWHVFDAGAQAEWIRLVSRDASKLTATFHYTDKDLHDGRKYAAMFEGLAGYDETGLVYHARLYPNHDNFNLTIHSGSITDGSFIPQDAFELNKYDFKYGHGLQDSTSLRILNNRTIWYEDEASVVLESAGQRLRLPKGKGSYTPEAIRNLRELASERELANIHGTFYEVPLLYVNQEGQYHMMRPVATHNRMISDMATWNGLLVLAGVKEQATSSPHIIRDKEQGLALWVGGMDDIWKLGKPVGEGGPWKDTPVRANQLSDKYLMTGYDRKTLALTADRDVEVSVYVHTTHYMGLDIGDEPWREIKTEPKPLLYKTFRLTAGETMIHVFPDGYSAHWLQLMASKDCIATGWLVYE